MQRAQLPRIALARRIEEVFRRWLICSGKSELELVIACAAGHVSSLVRATLPLGAPGARVVHRLLRVQYTLHLVVVPTQGELDSRVLEVLDRQLEWCLEIVRHGVQLQRLDVRLRSTRPYLF